jgi:RNA polymerase sigma factor (sigma-70 family)
MRQIVEDRQAEYRKPTHLEVLPGGRDTRARDLRQKRLAVKAKTDLKARGKLLAELYPLVEWQANKQRGLGVDHEDLMQEGMGGVLKAIQAYTPRRGASFATYAHSWIHGEMRRAIAYHQRTIRVPEYRVLIAGKERKARERVQRKLGRTPTDLDVARETGVEVEEVWRVAVETAPISSADVLMEAAEVEDDSDTEARPNEADVRHLLDPVGNPERIVMGRVLPEQVRDALCLLKPRDRRVLRMRHWGGYTRREIAERLGITQKAVRWSEERAGKVLKEEKNLREYWEFFWN